MGKALDLLKKGCSMEVGARSVKLPDGSDFVFYMKPLTIAQRAQAEKRAGKKASEDAMAFSLQLLCDCAVDERGNKLFSPADILDLRHNLPSSVVDDLLLKVLQDPTEPEDEEEEAVDVSPKTSRKSSKETTT